MNNLLTSLYITQINKINLQPGGDLVGSVQDLNIGDIVSGGLRLVLVVAALVFFFILVIGGIKWIMSGGDKAQTEGARNQITAALVGLVIVFSAWAIAQLLATFFNIRIFDLTIPTAGS
ncbi:hypothetical protein A2422_04015 [Candidatus Woesebacteria bacterium RIFOXYC1_FULL_31_51]|uniref:Uncharacterized protein n=1 Tax=Candidatus Woesebacteria bacterium GW2011_GWC2_31_9 TaxID=1618586 RepID=A0A0G0AZN1_9BACT|nr:MAG: divTM protein [Candidatus Woesebacteria bacterium GW2011_GWF1_31_35]KKP26894.1 MAG: hypothetical protein UR13_C0002G0129 [Candidatus Woesebacteria bacterium GW2011_GWD1_31_12]KKP27468.1 MAG: hypothetical protein UR16_C0003G0128 [Candidatus Woesebacteria bacterium GW2011_GWB1_31_29]KKP31126.1 MAG: hypothetical protein UR20_C0043G0009 [Candidatus Woesebacteria bacterium GW2011_GWE2_31_6]KKP32015.1 MAG: hypothetical protein UR21_C0003G0048 [Candidatus Woesebacteria bacterium GW2011_GWC2_31